MDMVAYYSQLALDRCSFSHCVCVAVCLVLLTSASTTVASDIPAIMKGLESDAVDTADQLLALGEQADRDPAMIHAFVNAARTLGRQGHWKKSIALLSRAREVHHHRLLNASPEDSESIAFLHTIDLAIASAAIQCSDFDRATQNASHVLQDSQSPARHRAAAYPLLIKAYHANSQLDQACQTLHQAAEDEQAHLAAAQLAELALTIGADCLKEKKAAAARITYQDYLTLAPDGPRVADAKLGLAWAAALGGASPADAAAKLVEFVSDFPQHRDAPHALRAAATCLDQADQAEPADAIRRQLLETFPHSEAASEVLAQSALAGATWPTHIRTAWRVRLAAADERSIILSQEQATAVFTESFRGSDDALWQAAVQWLIDADRDGTQTDAILNRLVAQAEEPLAEHLAVDLIAQADEPGQPQSPPACESACRWAGASERWSMLALAAEELGAPVPSSRRSMAVDRILAESLMQTQRPAEAMKWWDWLIDHRSADDFATLLRGAETSIAHGEIEIASSRVDSAKAAAGDDDFNLALTQILSAELFIRRARFDEARETLSEVVRESGSSSALRPRAQWMIGETHFLQQRYAEAIDAYRRVDAMDAAGEWAPAALLQAGKAFEKLGRGRDAAVCYTALLSRFADWPHATLAQSRLATLNPTGTAPDSVLR